MHRSSTVIQAKTGFKKYVGEFRCESTTDDGLFSLEEVDYEIIFCPEVIV